MPEQSNSPEFTPKPEPASAPLDAAVAEELRPLLRLRQLAREIDAALANNDMEIVSRAAALLAPTLAHWKEVQPHLTVGAGEAVQIALETRNLLDKCEAALAQAMLRIRAEMRRLQRGRRAIKAMRARQQHRLGRRVDLRR
jgi:hypothetical protein